MSSFIKKKLNSHRRSIPMNGSCKYIFHNRLSREFSIFYLFLFYFILFLTKRLTKKRLTKKRLTTINNNIGKTINNNSPEV
jgi:hypothetical protein